MPYDEEDRYYEEDAGYETGRMYPCPDCGAEFTYGEDAAACCEDDENGPGCGETERFLPATERARLTHPLRYILRRSGRIWSTEVEVNDTNPDHAARLLGCNHESYGSKPDSPRIIAASDCTVGAEIKVSCMRDGSKQHAHMATHAYLALRNGGATAGDNCGHHVHVDATRQADASSESVKRCMDAALTLARTCRAALTPIAATGFYGHRGDGGYAGSLAITTDQAIGYRNGLHASNAYGVAASLERDRGHDGIPTWEYRYPNGTTEDIRGHAHVAIALGLVDFGERAALDRDPDAREWLKRCTDREKHAAPWSEADAAAILSRALHLHRDSYTALSVAADNSPSASARHRAVWRIAATA